MSKFLVNLRALILKEPYDNIVKHVLQLIKGTCCSDLCSYKVQSCK